MEEKSKTDLNIELVEESVSKTTDSFSAELCPAGAPTFQAVEPQSVISAALNAPTIRTPQSVVIDGVLKALPFVVIPLLIVLSTQVFPSPFIVPIHASAGIRTLLMCAFIWNLIGAVLYAQANTRLSKALLVAVFATPLATIHIWGIVILSLITVLKATFPGPTVW